MEITNELKSLFKVVRTKLGAPIRRIELDDNAMCDLLEVAIGDYAEKVQNWIIQANWLNMNGQNINFLQNPQELAFAFTTTQLDFTRDYSYWFSRDVGLQQRGKFELKKDFIQVEKGKQCYLIPSGREINKVLYVTPSTTKAALYGNLGTLDTGMAGGFGQFGNLGNGMGITGFYVGSAYDTALMAADLKYKNSLLRGDLAYKVTAGPEGSHILHLLSTPGSPNMLGGTAADDSWGWNKYVNCYVWYTYYDVQGATDEEIDACRLENKSDILISPDQVPLSRMRFELMNEPTKQTIRQLLFAEAAMTIALIRGYASGAVKIPQAEMTLDYAQLMDIGKNEKERVFNELKERLESMLPWNMMKKYEEMTDSLNNILKHKPLGMFAI
jgi:hypothetical protein